MKGPPGKPRYGLLAEFNDQAALVRAIHAAHDAGYRRMEAYTPYPVTEVYEALRLKRTWVAPIVFLGGLTGCVAGYLMQYYLMAINYPINVGGRPLHSWPMFIPITFELTVLFAGISALVGMFALNGLPRLTHPLFSVEQFARATRDRFFLCIEAGDPRFHVTRTRAFLLEQNPNEVIDVAEMVP